ncbi:P1 family peptidase [Tomitella cavernea]|uniref:P1 family peptidase n=2 Tax=Tomitella cavernea TaxID=1387982 RepID=UPI0031ECB301
MAVGDVHGRPDASPGAVNAIVDVPGIRVGHAHRLDAGVTVGAADGSSDGGGWATGCTVVRMPDDGAVAAVDVRGGGPGTRETDLLDPAHTVQRVHAILLTGGSAFGLAAADGVMRRLEDEGVGIPMGGAGKAVPIVPGAVIFDLPVGGWRNRPDAAFGYAATAAAAAGGRTAGGRGAADAPGAAAIATAGGDSAGCVGAGVGARAGGLKGAVGSASAVIDGGAADGVTVGAIVVANPVGSVVDQGGVPWGAGSELAGEFAGLRRDPGPEVRARLAGLAAKGTVLNTTIGVVATDAALTPAGCRRLATVAHDGLARAIRPAHSPLDGDTLFAVATGLHDAPGAPDPAPQVPVEMPGDLALLTALCGPAADCVERAVVHAVLAAESVAGIPSYRAVIG